MFGKIDEKPQIDVTGFDTRIENGRRTIELNETQTSTLRMIIEICDDHFSLRFNNEEPPREQAFAHLNTIVGLATFDKLKETVPDLQNSVSQKDIVDLITDYKKNKSEKVESAALRAIEVLEKKIKARV